MQEASCTQRPPAAYHTAAGATLAPTLLPALHGVWTGEGNTQPTVGSLQRQLLDLQQQRARDTNNAAAALTSARQEIFRLQLLNAQNQFNASRHCQPSTPISDIQAVHHLDAVLLFKAHNNTSEKGARVHTIPLSRLTTMPGTHPISLMQLVRSGIKSVTLRLYTQVRATRLLQNDWLQFVDGNSPPLCALVTLIEPPISWIQVRADYAIRQRICALEGLTVESFEHLESHLCQFWGRDLTCAAVGRTTDVSIIHFRLGMM